MTVAATGERAGTFIATKEHRRFAEFADAVRKHRYIGLCYGPAGVGKTCSARRYARWDLAEPLLSTWGPRDPSEAKVYAALAQNRAIFYTPTVCCPFRELHGDIAKLITWVGVCISSHVHRDTLVQTGQMSDLAEVLIVDEAERLTRYVGDLLQMTRLDCRAIRPTAELTDFSDVLCNQAGRAPGGASQVGAQRHKDAGMIGQSNVV